MARDVSEWDAAQGRTQVQTEAGLTDRSAQPSWRRVLRQIPGFYKKNKGLAGDPVFWQMVRRLRALRAEQPRGQPRDRVLWVGTHHKSMTTYFAAVLKLYAYGTRQTYQGQTLEPLSDTARVVLAQHSKLALDTMPDHRGVHVMRDPRDMIVSGYHYHKWTHEPWVHRLDETGRSYQQKLLAVDKDVGLFMEIDHFLFFYRDLLETWDVSDPNILELRYEDLMGEDRGTLYGAMFQHFDIPQAEQEICVDLMRAFEAGRRTGRGAGKGVPQGTARKSHIRSGRSQQWKEELSPAHLDYIEAQMGPVLRKFGYDPH